MAPERVIRTFDTRRRGILERVHRNRNSRRTLGSVRNGAYLRSTLTEIGPFVGVGVVEAVGNGTVGAVDDTCAAGVFDSGHSLLVGVDCLRRDALGFMTCGVAEDLRGCRVRDVEQRSRLYLLDVPRTLAHACDA